MIVTNPESVTMTVIPSRKIAKFLLEIGAIKFNIHNPFIWTSGIQSPIYCDNRIINSKVHVRDAVIAELSGIVAKNFLSDKNDIIIAGVVTGGITYGVLIADRLKLPFIYVRAERKEHGLKKIIEGDFNPGAKVVLIEDHISTGISSRRAVESLRAEGAEVVCLLSIMTYGFKTTQEEYKKENIPHASICDLDTVLEVAEEEGILSPDDVKTILRFRESPKDWK